MDMVTTRFGLKEKSEADSNEYIKKIIEIDERHVRKYAKRSMSLKELDKLCGFLK